MAKVLTLDVDKLKSRIRKAQVLFDSGEADEAFRVMQDLLAENPNEPQTLVLMAACLKKAKKTPIAYSLARRATEVKPERPEPWQVFGHCAQGLWRLDEAMSAYDKALARAETDAQRALFLTDIASIHLDRGEFAKAESPLRKALAIKDSWNTRHNFGLSMLAQKKWPDGWENYSSSIGTEARVNWKYRHPEEEPTWDGTKGQKVIVYGEQGLGDEICFASMVPDAAKDARLILDCDSRLKGLFQRSFPQCKVYGTRWEKKLDWAKEDQDFDASISSAELGRHYRQTTESFPVKPYLKADSERRLMWQALFAEKRKPVIGIAYSGGTYQNGEIYRYAALEDWLPLFDSIDAHFVSLQYKQVGQSVADFKFAHPEVDIAEYPWATMTKDYDDTAALVSALDCVVSVPTTVVHLAGALGVPTVMMKFRYQCWKTAAGVPFHPLHSIIGWRGEWKDSIAAAIEPVREICKDKFGSGTIRANL